MCVKHCLHDLMWTDTVGVTDWLQRQARVWLEITVASSGTSLNESCGCVEIHVHANDCLEMLIGIAVVVVVVVAVVVAVVVVV